MSNLTQQIAQAAERGGATVAVTGGSWAWLAQNYQAIGAISAMMGVAIALAGFVLNWWYLHHRGGGA